MNTRMQFLEHELAEHEREQQRKEEPAETQVQQNSDAFIQMERKIRELDALVNGLREELLDMKSQFRKVVAFMERNGGAATPTRNVQPTPSRSGVRRPDVVPEPVSQTVPTHAVRQTPIHSVAQSQLSAQENMRKSTVQKPIDIVSGDESSRRRISSPVPQKKQEEEPEEFLGPGEYEFVMQPDGTIQKRRKTKHENVIIAGTGYGPGHASHSSAIRADSSAVIEAEEDDSVDITK